MLAGRSRARQETDQTFRYGQAPDRLCLDAGTTVNCQMPEFASRTYCNASQPVAERVRSLISYMDDAQKVQLLTVRAARTAVARDDSDGSSSNCCSCRCSVPHR